MENRKDTTHDRIIQTELINVFCVHIIQGPVCSSTHSPSGGLDKIEFPRFRAFGIRDCQLGLRNLRIIHLDRISGTAHLVHARHADLHTQRRPVIASNKKYQGYLVAELLPPQIPPGSKPEVYLAPEQSVKAACLSETIEPNRILACRVPNLWLDSSYRRNSDLRRSMCARCSAPILSGLFFRSGGMTLCDALRYFMVKAP